MFSFIARRRTAIPALVVLGLMSLAGTPSPQVSATSAPTLGWIQWTNPGTFGQTATKPVIAGSYKFAREASGQLQLPGGNLVYVKFEGEVVAKDNGSVDTTLDSPSAFGTSGSTYWSQLGGGDGSHFTSASVPTLPPNSDRIAVSGNEPQGGEAQQRLSFYSNAAMTAPVNVANIVLLFRSLGAGSIPGTWDFDNDFAILSSGLGGNGVSGTLPTRTLISGGARLSGAEANGSIQFTGTFSSISWTVTAPEFFAVWNVGATSAAPLGADATLTPSQTSVTGAVGTAISGVSMTPAGLGGAVTYSYTGDLPPGLSFNTTTGAITGEPTTAGDYSIVVTATGATYGSATTTVNFSVASSPSVPAITGTTAGDTVADITWTAPTSTGGAPITDYSVQYRVGSSGDWTTFDDGVSTDLSTTITGLTNGTTYEVRIAAVNSAGTGAYTDPVSVTPSAPPSTTEAPSTTEPPTTTKPPTTSEPVPAEDVSLPATGGLADILLAVGALLLVSGVRLASVGRRTARR